jgi:hypothetical protein
VVKDPGARDQSLLMTGDAHSADANQFMSTEIGNATWNA